MAFSRRSLGALVACVTGIHAVLLGWSVWLHSPTFNELGHLPAGICHWQHGFFDLYRVNPPLPRMVAALPVLSLNPRTDWTEYGADPLSREEISMGIKFARANGADTFRLFTVARWAGIPFSIAGALACYLWTADLWGTPSGLLVLGLWCFNPAILGNGALVMPDVPAAAAGVWASYLFWRWLREPSWLAAFAAGGALGVALLCKTTLLVFLAVWPALWIARLCAERGLAARAVWVGSLGEAGQLGGAVVVALVLVNAGYGFTGSLARLDSFQFCSRTLGGVTTPGAASGNRFAGTALGAVPVPVPRDYLQGIDRQRADFEIPARSYLRGEWKMGGWWYYHLYALAIKTPLGTLLLILVAALAALVSAKYRLALVDELCLLLPAIAIIGLVSSQTGFSNHSRYTIPALPFLFVFASRTALAFPYRQRAVATLAALGIAWTTIGSLAIYPHSISYFNELVGGPKNGHWHLLDSNIAWGQDLLLLRKWIDRHPEAADIRTATFGWVSPRLVGIKTPLPPVGPTGRTPLPPDRVDQELGPLPGWYAVDVNFLHGSHWPAQNGRGGWNYIPTDGPNFEYFLKFEPTAMVGYSTYIYRVTRKDANRVRAELGLPPPQES